MRQEVADAVQNENTLAELLATLEPPQPQLLGVLLKAGVTDMSRFRFIARDSTSAELFLRELRAAKTVDIFEYIYLKMALRVL